MKGALESPAARPDCPCHMLSVLLEFYRGHVSVLYVHFACYNKNRIANTQDSTEIDTGEARLARLYHTVKPGAQSINQSGYITFFSRETETNIRILPGGIFVW